MLFSSLIVISSFQRKSQEASGMNTLKDTSGWHIVKSKVVNIVSLVLFASGSDARKGKGAFVETAFVNFKKVYKMCSAHAERKYHCDAVVACDAFIEIMSGRRESVAIQLERNLRNTVKSNREKLHSIIETVVFCDHQNISLRGLWDSYMNVEGVHSEGTNHGNFWALLDFRVLAGDTVHAAHLAMADKNTVHMSSDMQNQIFEFLVTLSVRQIWRRFAQVSAILW